MSQARQPTSLVAAAAFAALAFGAAACSSTSGPSTLMTGSTPSPFTGPAIDEQAVLAAVSHQNYQTDPKFKRVSVLFPSNKDPVNVATWISADAADDYLFIDPNVMAPNGPDKFLPEGTIIVRAAYDATNFTDYSKVNVLTILTKGPPGYLESFGDWAFAVTDPDGNVLPTSTVFPSNDDASPPDTTPVFGTVAGCHGGCHENQRGMANDFLFGIDPKYRVGDD